METEGASRLKKTGTREEVYKGLAMRTAGGLKRDDIIPKQFGSRVLYISKRLSDRMRANFNIIRASNPNHFKRQIKKTQCASNQSNSSKSPNVNNLDTDTSQIDIKTDTRNEAKKKQNSKTMKLAFKIDENVEKNIYYKELKGMDIKELKDELKREEAEEDLGVTQSYNNQPKKTFSIETMPDIDISSLE